MENQNNRGNRNLAVEKKKYGVHVLVREYAKSYRALALVEIPDQYRRVGEEAFRDSRALEKVVFPKSMVELGERAFCFCSKRGKR